MAITSDKPQTTRRAIRGILNRPAGQLVIVDTPGIHKPRTLLGERLKDVGTRARASIEAMLGTPVYLDLRVKIAKDWQRDPKQLRRLGF